MTYPMTLTATHRIIPATAHDDDHQHRVAFEALPWFRQARAQEIRDLVECNWGGDYPADGVAQYMEDHSPDLARMFAYVQDRQDLGYSTASECHVDANAARAWLAIHRPATLAWIEATEAEPAPPPTAEDEQAALQGLLAEQYGFFDPADLVLELVGIGAAVAGLARFTETGLHGRALAALVLFGQAVRTAETAEALAALVPDLARLADLLNRVIATAPRDAQEPAGRLAATWERLRRQLLYLFDAERLAAEWPALPPLD